MKDDTQAMSEPLLELHGVKSNAAGALGAVDLLLYAHEILCLSGVSGSGKSLLLRAIADLDPAAGELSLRNQRCAQMSGPEWRRQVVFVAAESAWWADTAGEHFRCDGPRLARLGLQPAVMTRPLSSLSTGERQRLALLRALALSPPVLLLDEPTAALDEQSRLATERLIRSYVDDHVAAALWVSHDQAQIDRIADRHLQIRNGALAAASEVN